MEFASVIALLKALQPYIPLALMGFKKARAIVDWGTATVQKAVAEGRGISQDEWNEWNRMVAEIHEAIQSS